MQKSDLKENRRQLKLLEQEKQRVARLAAKAQATEPAPETDVADPGVSRSTRRSRASES